MASAPRPFAITLQRLLTSGELIVRPQDHTDFDTVQNALLAELDPQGAIETLTFHDLFHAAWTLRRLRRHEAECDPSDAKAYDRITRQQSRAQRAYYKALKELRTLQTNRALRASKLEDPADPEVPVITDINQLTKQTHSEVTAEGIKQAIHLLDLQSGMFLRDAREKRQRAAPSAPVKDDRALRL